MFRPQLSLLGVVLAPAVASAWQSAPLEPVSVPASIAPAATRVHEDPRVPFGPAPRADRGPLPPVSSVPRDGAPTWQLVPANAPAPTPRLEQLDDSIPLPNPPVYAVGPNGDELVQPESGDPFFLGFAAGKHFPPADESVDPLLVAQAQTAYADGRPHQETYAFAMMKKRITPARVAALEALGARVLEFHPHYSLKIALPASATCPPSTT